MKLLFEEIEDVKKFDKLFLEITADILKSRHTSLAYPEVLHPSALLSNFGVRDDSKILVALMHEQPVGLTCFIQSDLTFLPAPFVNRIFFLLRSPQAKQIEDPLIKEIIKAYSTLKVSGISYIRLTPLEILSPSGRRLGKHQFKKRFSMNRMARRLQNIPRHHAEHGLVLRRVKWEEKDLMLFMKTWAQGFGWPAKYIDQIANGMARRLLERNMQDPDTWINFLVEADGQPVGTAAILTFPESAYVVNVSTLKEFRRRGFATFTMLSLMEWCRSRGMNFMALDVEPHDIAAVNLYKKLNFKEFGKSAGYVKKF